MRTLSDATGKPATVHVTCPECKRRLIGRVRRQSDGIPTGEQAVVPRHKPQVS